MAPRPRPDTGQDRADEPRVHRAHTTIPGTTTFHMYSENQAENTLKYTEITEHDNRIED